MAAAETVTRNSGELPYWPLEEKTLASCLVGPDSFLELTLHIQSRLVGAQTGHSGLPTTFVLQYSEGQLSYVVTVFMHF